MFPHFGGTRGGVEESFATLMVLAFLVQRGRALVHVPGTWTSSLATSRQQLRKDGFVVLPPEVNVGAGLVGEVAAEARDRMAVLLQAVEVAEIEGGAEARYLFAEICHRQSRRWDLKMEDTPAWLDLCSRAVQLAAPVIQEIQEVQEIQEIQEVQEIQEIQEVQETQDVSEEGRTPKAATKLRVITSGVVASHAGAREQLFHADGGAGLFNIFVPLVDIGASSDGTQFWPGSQRHPAASAEEALALAQDAKCMAQMVSPACPKGGLLVFDYQTIHRGLSNGKSTMVRRGKKKKVTVTGRERAIAYVVVATNEHAADTNFPERSVFDAGPSSSKLTKTCAPSVRMNDFFTGNVIPESN